MFLQGFWAYSEERKYFFNHLLPLRRCTQHSESVKMPEAAIPTVLQPPSTHHCERSTVNRKSLMCKCARQASICSQPTTKACGAHQNQTTAVI
jgi:hypothetical protein